MNRFLGLCLCGALLCPAPPALADDEPAPFDIVRAGDMDLDCNELSDEVSKLTQLIGFTRQVQHDHTAAKTGVGIVRTVGGLLIGSLGGAIGIMAAGQLVSSASEDRREDAEALEDAAAQRRSMIVGIYNAKECAGPLPVMPELEMDGPDGIEPAAGEAANEKARLKPRSSYNN